MSETDTETPQQDEPQEDERPEFEVPPGVEPTPDDEPTPDEQPQPEQPQEVTSGTLEARRDTARKRAKTYEQALERIYEEEWADHFRCPLCSEDAPGYIYAGDVGRYPPEVSQAVAFVLTGNQKEEYEQDPDHRACETCGARGFVATGSRVTGNERLKCPTCKGFGYVPPPAAPQNGHVEPDAAQTLAPERPSDVSADEIDGWGIARYMPDGRENPNWMRPPHAWNPDFPVGNVAGYATAPAA